MPVNSTYPTRIFERRILATYNRATNSDISAGMTWYSVAHSICSNLGAQTLNGVETAAGIISALSPQISWKKNIELASECIASEGYAGHMYGANNRKAKKIFDGHAPLDVLGGDKTRAFYSCILYAGNCEDVVIDRHAVAVALGRIASEKERMHIRGKRYRTYAAAYRNVARKVGLKPSELQAIVWVTWRREHGIVD